MKLAQIEFQGLLNQMDGEGNRVVYGTGAVTIADTIANATTYIFAFAGIALLFYLILGGFKLMLSGGDPKKTQEGKQIITNAFMGFIIIFVAYWIVRLFGLIFGINDLTSWPFK